MAKRRVGASGKGEAGGGRAAKKGALKQKGPRGPGKRTGSAGGKGAGRGRSRGRGKGGKKAGRGKAKGGGKGGAGRAKGAGKGKGGAEAAAPGGPPRGKKRSASGGAGDAPAASGEEGGAEEEKGKKGGKRLSVRKQRRKEVTKLYSELINPGRSRKGDAVVGEILETLTRRTSPLAEYCSKDVGSRVLQACLKWGTKEQRRQLLLALKEHIAKLAVDRYGHVVVLKLLRYVVRTSTARKPTDEERKAQVQNLKELLEAFRGKNLHAIFYHRHGCRVVNGIYFSDVVSAKERRRLLHEVAVPQAVALRRPELPGSRALRQLLRAEDVPKEQRDAMLEHLREAAEKAVDKELLAYDIVHLLFQAFCEVASEAQLKDLADKCMGGAPYLLSSKPGAEALLRLLGVATAKQRKALCRDLKGKFAALATNSVDYLVMMRLAGTVDDTVLLTKTMLAEWIPELATIAFDKYGHRVLAWLLQPADRHLFSPYERECLALPAPASLKAPEARQQELMRALRPPLRAVLLEGPLKAAADLHAKDLLVAYLAADWDAELAEGLIAACECEAAAEKDLGLFGSGTTQTTLLALLKLEEEAGEVEGGLAMPLWRRCLEPRLPVVATSRCSFLLLGLLKRGGKVREAVLAALRRQRKEIEAAAKAAKAKGAPVTGAEQLLKAAQEAAAGAPPA